MEVLGESLARGNNRFYGGIEDEDDINDDIEDTIENESINIESQPTPSYRQYRESTSSSANIIPQESRASKRHRESNEGYQQEKKKTKVSGARALDSMVSGIESIAQAFSREFETPKESVDTSLTGQAMILIQTEGYL